MHPIHAVLGGGFKFQTDRVSRSGGEVRTDSQTIPIVPSKSFAIGLPKMVMAAAETQRGGGNNETEHRHDVDVVKVAVRDR